MRQKQSGLVDNGDYVNQRFPIFRQANPPRGPSRLGVAYGTQEFSVEIALGEILRVLELILATLERIEDEIKSRH